MKPQYFCKCGTEIEHWQDMCDLCTLAENSEIRSRERAKAMAEHAEEMYEILKMYWEWETDLFCGDTLRLNKNGDDDSITIRLPQLTSERSDKWVEIMAKKYAILSKIEGRE